MTNSTPRAQRFLDHVRPLLAISCGLAVLLFSWPAAARPEYAIKFKMACTSCHVSPWGGGPKTVFGKNIGSRDYGPGKSSGTDLYSGSLRAIAFYPTSNLTQSGGGLALMEASASANVPIRVDAETGSELRVVGTYNMAVLKSGVREAYFRWKPQADEVKPVSYIVVGRFNSPFGLLTDEHRTYTRLQTNMTLNDFEMGAAVSGEPIESLHYDLALTNDFQTGGSFTQGDVTWGEIFNLRWSPDFMPLFLGFSQNFQHTLLSPQPFAFSLYSALSLDRLTGNFLHGSLLAEGVLAKNWNQNALNPDLAPFFLPASDTAYQSAAAASQSLGFYVQAKYDLTQRWSLIYRLDYLNLDTGYAGDAFFRHGFGFEFFPSSNLIFDARYEKAVVGRPEIVGTNAFSAEDDVLGMLRLWL